MSRILTKLVETDKENLVVNYLASHANANADQS